MREYEVTVLIKPDIDDDTRAQMVERVTGWLTQGESDDDKPVVDHWGHRTLAYPIRKFTEAYYVFYIAKLDPTTISEIERNMMYAEDILRHLFVRKED